MEIINHYQLDWGLRCMRFDKKFIMLLLIIILLALLLFLPSIINLIPSYEVKFVITIIFLILIFFFLVYVTYNDVRKKQFTTTAYIVLIEVITLIVYVVVCYTSFKNLNVIDTKILLQENHIRVASLIFLLCSSIVLNFLKSERFIKKIKSLK